MCPSNPLLAKQYRKQLASMCNTFRASSSLNHHLPNDASQQASAEHILPQISAASSRTIGIAATFASQRAIARARSLGSVRSFAWCSLQACFVPWDETTFTWKLGGTHTRVRTENVPKVGLMRYRFLVLLCSGVHLNMLAAGLRWLGDTKRWSDSGSRVEVVFLLSI